MPLSDILKKYNIEPKSVNLTEEIKDAKTSDSPSVSAPSSDPNGIITLPEKNLPDQKNNDNSKIPPNSPDSNLSWGEIIAQRSQSLAAIAPPPISPKIELKNPFPEPPTTIPSNSGIDGIKSFFSSIVPVEDGSKLLNILERRWGKDDLRDNLDLAKIISRIGANFVQKLGEMGVNAQSNSNSGQNQRVKKSPIQKPITPEEAFLVL